MTTDSGPLPADAPDVAGVVTGWRRWTLAFDDDDEDDGRPRLASPLRRTLWEPRRPTVARCVSGHAAPTGSCSCGLYAVIDALAAISATINGTGGQVLGCVALWGDLVEGDLGVRASHGYPQLLIVDPEVDTAEIARLGREYGVPVHRSPVSLDAVPSGPQSPTGDPGNWFSRRRAHHGDAVRSAAERVRRDLAADPATTDGAAGTRHVASLLTAMDREVRRRRNAMRATVTATLGVLLRLSVVPALYCALLGQVVSWQQTAGPRSGLPGLVVLALLPVGLRVLYEILVGLVRWGVVTATRIPGVGGWLSAGTVLPLGATSVLGAMSVGAGVLDGHAPAPWPLVPVPVTLMAYLVAFWWIGRRRTGRTTPGRPAGTPSPGRR